MTLEGWSSGLYTGVELRVAFVGGAGVRLGFKVCRLGDLALEGFLR